MKRARSMVVVLAMSLGMLGVASAQTDNGEWRSYGGDNIYR